MQNKVCIQIFKFYINIKVLKQKLFYVYGSIYYLDTSF